MNKKLLPYAYGGMFLILFFLERISKGYALCFFADQPPQTICDGLAFAFSWNHGITWSLCSTNTYVGALILSLIVSAVLFSFVLFTIQEYQHQKSLIP